MRKRKWYVALLFIAFLASLAAFAYEASTQAVRGWLRGEAFYDGRPTSYWRERCDEWISAFPDQDCLTNWTWLLPFELPNDPALRMFGFDDDFPANGGVGPAMPQETKWKYFRDVFRTKAELERNLAYYHAPRILWATPDTEPVLKELQLEGKYQHLATLALRRVLRFREAQARVEAEAKGAKQ